MLFEWMKTEITFSFIDFTPLSLSFNLVFFFFFGVGGICLIRDPVHPHLCRLFAVVDDIFCLFEGSIENISLLKQQYGLNKTANEVTIVIEAYKTLRDRGPYPADQVVRDLRGKFAFILYDSMSKAAFIAAVSKIHRPLLGENLRSLWFPCSLLWLLDYFCS